MTTPRPVTAGAIVQCDPNTGCATPGTLYGVVRSAGPRQAWVTWESGLTQRIRGSSLAQISAVTDPDRLAEARATLVRRGVIDSARPVTGPDGDNPITDEQIRELSRAARLRMSRSQAEIGDDEIERAACIAFDRRFTNRRRINARDSLAAAYNARHTGKEGP